MRDRRRCCNRQCGRQCNRRSRPTRSANTGASARSTRREESIMQPFEYASPSNLKDALAMLGNQWGETDILAGGTDQLSLMKDFIHTPKRVVNIKGIKELGGIHSTSQGVRIGATVTFDELANNRE